MTEKVVLVNENDEVLGVEEKLATHLRGALHRAFSIFVFNSTGSLLVQRRTASKYHSAGLWSNTCCGHPRLGESTEAASRRRLFEEMGFDCELQKVFEFVYYAELGDGLFEHEYDHVLVGLFNGIPNPNPQEVDDWRWVELPKLKLELQQNPTHFTHWFRVALEPLWNRIQSSQIECVESATVNAHVVQDQWISSNSQL